MEFLRQNGIFNPNEQNLNIHIVGCGSTGSFIALNLAKLGFESILVTDFDKVEAHNIPNQFYRIKDIGNYKVLALREIIEEFTGTIIETQDFKVDENYEFDIDLNTLIIICVDTMDARKLIYSKIKESPTKIIDLRLGGEGFQIYYIDLSSEEQKKLYENSLEAETIEAPCGQKAIIYSVLNIASETCNLVKRIDKGEPVPNIIKRQMQTYKILNNLEE